MLAVHHYYRFKLSLTDVGELMSIRGIKTRYKPMKGFKNIFCALIFCTVFEEIRQFFRMAQ